MAELSVELRELRDRLYDGGGSTRIERQHSQGKLTARERIQLLLDEGEPAVEIGLLVAHDLYDGQAPGAGVVTMVGRVSGREVVVVANDATEVGSGFEVPTNRVTFLSRDGAPEELPLMSKEAVAEELIERVLRGLDGKA